MRQCREHPSSKLAQRSSAPGRAAGSPVLAFWILALAAAVSFAAGSCGKREAGQRGTQSGRGAEAGQSSNTSGGTASNSGGGANEVSGGGTGGTSGASGASAPWIVLQKTGGIAGFQLDLEVQPDGRWRAQDRARKKETSGTFAPATLDTLKRDLEAIPAEQWSTFESKVVDDFQYSVTVRSGDQARRLQAGGTTLPAAWRAPLAILERPWPALFQAR